MKEREKERGTKQRHDGSGEKANKDIMEAGRRQAKTLLKGGEGKQRHDERGRRKAKT